MVYYRSRNSRYANYARANQGHANFIGFDPSMFDPSQLQAMGSGALDAIQNAGSQGLHQVQGAWDAVGNAASPYINQAGDALQAAGGRIASGAGQIGDALQAGAGRVADAFGNLPMAGKVGVGAAGAAAAGGAGLASRDAVRGIRHARKAKQAAAATNPNMLQRIQQGAAGLASNPLARKVGIGAAAVGGLGAAGLGGKYLYDQMNEAPMSMYTRSIASMCSNPENAAYFTQARRLNSRRYR